MERFPKLWFHEFVNVELHLFPGVGRDVEYSCVHTNRVLGTYLNTVPTIDADAQVDVKADRILFDLKLVDDAAHKKFTGVSNDLILTNFRTARASDKVQVRFPVIPGITDNPENIEHLAQMAAASGKIKRFDLLPYHRTAAAKYQRLGLVDRMNGTAAPTTEQMDILKDRIARYGFTVRVGG